MSDKKMEEFERRVKERMLEYEDELSSLSGLQLKLVKDALHDYCRICVQLDDVTEKCIRTGTTIENIQGNLVKNPDITTMHQFANEKNSLLPKLLKYAQGSGDEEDEFEVWLGN